MSLGLIWFTLADSTVAPNFNLTGKGLLYLGFSYSKLFIEVLRVLQVSDEKCSFHGSSALAESEAFILSVSF